MRAAEAFEELAQQERDILRHEDGELGHQLFASVTARLPDSKKANFESAGFALEQPESEMFLEYMVPTAMAKNDISSKALCVDVYTSEFLKVEATPAARKKQLVNQLQRAWSKNKDDETPPHQRSVCNDENYQVFADAGLAWDDAQGCVYALSFYSGGGSNESSRGASLQVRKGNIIYSDESEIDAFLEDYNHIIFYVSAALRSLPYHWGPVVRFVTLTEEAARNYVPGNIVTWMQFSSSKKGLEAAASFKGRNCKFVVWSIKGRHIARFSNFGVAEDEVLFTPFTRLLVLKVERRDGVDGIEYTIHLREIELGLTKGLPLLWVDDKILDADFEMKGMMEQAMVRAGRDIKYILKPSTKLALAFLKSWFGEQARKNPNFRVMSDMGRPGEADGRYAGANLVKAMADIHLKVPTMIFTSSTDRGLSMISERAPTVKASKAPFKTCKPPLDIVLVTEEQDPALTFCSFEASPEAAASGCKAS